MYSAGEIIDGQVTKLVPFGAFVRVAAGIEGLVHISEISDQHIESAEAVLTVGDEVRVKVIEVDVPRRRISLSMRQVGGALPRPATEIEEESAPAAPDVVVAPPSTPGESSTASLEVVAVSSVDEPPAPAEGAPSLQEPQAAAESVAAEAEPVAAGPTEVAVGTGADGEAGGLADGRSAGERRRR
jgi:small subunit ribosomal protein S1